MVSFTSTMRTRSRRVELHHLPSGSIAAYDHSEESLERHLGRAEAIAEEASAAQSLWHEQLAARVEDAADGDADAIEASPGSMCSWCDFRRHCPSGREASTDLAPWDGLAEQA